MSDINNTIISGRLTKDPAVRGGGNVAQLSVASNRQYQRNGEWVEEVVYLDVSCFGHIAKKAIDKLIKGAFVTVVGRLELNRWQAEDGSNRSQIRLVANQLLSPAFQGRTAARPPRTRRSCRRRRAVTESSGWPRRDASIPF
jgi:single-strand DNA-binding protein